jgi:hypothetical protein
MGSEIGRFGELWGDPEEALEVLFKDGEGCIRGQLPERGGIHQRTLDVRGFVTVARHGTQVRTIRLEEELRARHSLEHSGEGLGTRSIARDGQVMASGSNLLGKLQFAPEAVPQHASGGTLRQELEAAFFALSGVHDQGLVGFASDRDELKKDLLLSPPKGFRYPIPVQSDLADRKGLGDMLLNEGDAFLCRVLVPFPRVIDAGRSHLGKDRIHGIQAQGRPHQGFTSSEFEHGSIILKVQSIGDDGRQSTFSRSEEHGREILRKLRVSQVGVNVEETHDLKEEGGSRT